MRVNNLPNVIAEQPRAKPMISSLWCP